MVITIHCTALPPNHNPKVVTEAVKNLTDALSLFGIEIIDVKIEK